MGSSLRRAAGRSSLHAAACLFALLATTGAGAQVVGKAGAVELTDADVRRLVDALPEGSRVTARDAAALEQLVRAELLRRVVLADAKANGFDRDARAQAELERMREETVVRAWLESRARVPDGYPADAEVRAAYEAAVRSTGAASEYRLAQIFVALADGAPAERLAAALLKAQDLQSRIPGGDFAALARRESEHAESAARGGELDAVAEANLVPEVRAAVVGLAVGSVAGPVKSAQGLHWVKLLEKRPAPVPGLGDVREALVAALRRQKAAELQQAYLAGLAAKAPASVNQIELARLSAAIR